MHRASLAASEPGNSWFRAMFTLVPLGLRVEPEPLAGKVLN